MTHDSSAPPIPIPIPVSPTASDISRHSSSSFSQHSSHSSIHDEIHTTIHRKRVDVNEPFHQQKWLQPFKYVHKVDVTSPTTFATSLLHLLPLDKDTTISQLYDMMNAIPIHKEACIGVSQDIPTLIMTALIGVASDPTLPTYISSRDTLLIPIFELIRMMLHDDKRWRDCFYLNENGGGTSLTLLLATRAPTINLSDPHDLFVWQSCITVCARYSWFDGTLIYAVYIQHLRQQMEYVYALPQQTRLAHLNESFTRLLHTIHNSHFADATDEEKTRQRLVHTQSLVDAEGEDGIHQLLLFHQYLKKNHMKCTSLQPLIQLIATHSRQAHEICERQQFWKSEVTCTCIIS